jgi:hypothetical protein
VIIWTTTHNTQSHRGKDQDKKEPHANLGLLAETEAHGWLACVQAPPGPGLVGLFCEKRTILWTNVVQSLPTFCFRWLQLLVSGLAVVFAIQAAACAPTPQSFDGVLPLLLSVKHLAVALLAVGAQAGALLQSVTSVL